MASPFEWSHSQIFRFASLKGWTDSKVKTLYNYEPSQIENVTFNLSCFMWRASMKLNSYQKSLVVLSLPVWGTFGNRAVKVSRATERWTAMKRSILVLCIIDPVLLGLKITLPKVTWWHIIVCFGTMWLRRAHFISAAYSRMLWLFIVKNEASLPAWRLHWSAGYTGAHD